MYCGFIWIVDSLTLTGFRYHPASQHALLQGLVWKTYRVPKPCCAPHVLADVDVLHLDESNPNELKVSTWKGMQVKKCACS